MDTVIDVEKMSSQEKIDFLKNVFERQRRLDEENLNGWILDLFLYDLNRIYTNHRDETLNKLYNQKTNNEILEIILSYF